MKQPITHGTSAIVLSRVATGLATVRCLAKAGVDVHAFIVEDNASIRFSRYCKKIDLSRLHLDEAGFIEFLIDYAKQFSLPPVIFPCSDEYALLLAKHAERLRHHCTVFSTDYEVLCSIVHKHTLYQLAAAAGLPTVPAITEPSYDEVLAWSAMNEAPYFIKPFYEGLATAKLQTKNLLIHSRTALLEYVKTHGADSLVIQRMLRGGDGFIFDCYGYTNRQGDVVTIASHRRWRQHLPDTGATCYGVIPAGISKLDEELLFSNTLRLLKQTRYHGIFGIEWLYDRATGQYYIIDFNARPFVTIGHLLACGLNLPFIAYKELTGLALNDVSLVPPLKTLFWVDLLKDMESYSQKHSLGQMQFLPWLKSLLTCRSFAYWDLRDPLPGLHRLLQVGKRCFSYPFKSH